MVNDFQKHNTAIRPISIGSIEIDGIRYFLDNDENRYTWFKGIVPTCVCGEPLLTENEQRLHNVLAPVEYSTWIDRDVVCDECGHRYPVQP